MSNQNVLPRPAELATPTVPSIASASRATEAAGDLTDNDELKREGEIDQGKGKVKDFVDKVADKLK
jgi:hypothetical protein